MFEMLEIVRGRIPRNPSTVVSAQQLYDADRLRSWSVQQSMPRLERVNLLYLCPDASCSYASARADLVRQHIRNKKNTTNRASKLAHKRLGSACLWKSDCELGRSSPQQAQTDSSAVTCPEQQAPTPLEGSKRYVALTSASEAQHTTQHIELGHHAPAQGDSEV